MRTVSPPAAYWRPRWGRPWSTTWFRLTGDVPAAWDGADVEAVVRDYYNINPGQDNFEYQDSPEHQRWQAWHPQTKAPA